MSGSVRLGQDVRKAFKTHLGEVATPRQARYSAPDNLESTLYKFTSRRVDSLVYFKTGIAKAFPHTHRWVNGGSQFHRPDIRRLVFFFILGGLSGCLASILINHT